MPRKKITDWSIYSKETRAIREGYERSHENEHSEAVYLTSSYVFESAEMASKKFTNKEQGNVYSRFTNPTVRAFEHRLAALDGAQSCIATSSGMAAISLMCLSLLKSGDHVVCSRSVFGSITVLFSDILTRFGIEVDFVSPLELDQWEKSVNANTKMFFAETPSNPIQELVDIKRLSALAHDYNILLAVDNSFCTPILQQPLRLGADICIYTATKFIDGQGRCVGGAICGKEEHLEPIFTTMRTMGMCMSPFNAWVFLKGLETLSLRMHSISERAMSLAQWLESHPLVEQVFYTWLPSHKQYDLARSQQQAGGGVVSFTLNVADHQIFDFIDHTALLSLTGNLGDVKSIITHPASTTHSRLSEQERKATGVTNNLIRISVGLESVDDIIHDLEQGFAAVS